MCLKATYGTRNMFVNSKPQGSREDVRASSLFRWSPSILDGTELILHLACRHIHTLLLGGSLSLSPLSDIMFHHMQFVLMWCGLLLMSSLYINIYSYILLWESDAWEKSLCSSLTAHPQICYFCIWVGQKTICSTQRTPIADHIGESGQTRTSSKDQTSIITSLSQETGLNVNTFTVIM